MTSPIRGRRVWWGVPALLYTLGLAFFTLAIATQVPADAFPPLAGMLALLAAVALIGFFEEVLFRGILLHGLEQRFGPIAALLLSSLVFGLMHYVNWIGGQPLSDTHVQVAHAAITGLAYGALTLLTGSIWPSVILHALWDGAVSLFSTVLSAMPDDMVVATNTVSAVEALPEDAATSTSGWHAFLTGYEPIYGVLLLLVVWQSLRWDQRASGQRF